MRLNGPLLAELRIEAATTRSLLERVPDDSLAWRPHPRSRSLGELASHVARAGEVLASLDDERFLASWRYSVGGRTMFELPRFVVARTTAFNHMIHHRGQLSVYLRLLEVPLPPIYGPTADSAAG